MQNRLQTNTQFMKRSLEIIARHKRFLILPIINLITSIGLFALILTPLIHIETAAWEHSTQLSGKAILHFFIIFLIYLLISNVIVLIFHAALCIYTIQYIKNETCTLITCFMRALKNTTQIFYFKLLCDTLFPLIRLLEYWMDDWSKTKFATRTLSELRFRVAKYLMIPILSNEKITAWHALKRSAQLINTTWGTSLRPRMTMTMTIIWLHALSLVPALIAIIIGGKTIIVIGAVISVILFLCVTTLYATAHIILTSALYLFASGNKNTSRFYEDSLLQNAFQSIKKSKRTTNDC